MTSIDKVIKDIIEGKPIIITDSMDRENEGDIMIAAEKATKESLAFMCLKGRGIMCLPCLPERLERLEIKMMHSNKLDRFATPFANSIDASSDIATGVSVSDRLITINRFIDDNSKPSDFCQPGHLFPLSTLYPLKVRQAHTQASVELCKLANLKQVAVIVEVMNDDGSMSRLPELEKLAKIYDLHIVNIEQIVQYIEGL